MTTYKVSSIFRDRAGKTLRRSTTFHDEAPDAREALRYAHITMTPLVAADPRIDSISSTVTGGGETISTTDYADELSCGIASAGLMNEINASMLDGRADTTLQDALGILTDEQKQALVDAGKTKEVAASGADGFPGSAASGTGRNLGSFPSVSKDAQSNAPGIGGASVDADPFRSGRSEQGRITNGPDTGTPQGSVAGAGTTQRPSIQPSLPLGAPYQGNDITGDIIRAKESMECALGPDRAPTAIRLGQSAYDALVKEMERLNRGKRIAGPITIAGLPVILHNDPNMAPIQVEVGRRFKPFDMMGLNPGQRNAPLIIIDEAAEIDDAVWKKLRKAFSSAECNRHYGVPAWLTPSEFVKTKEMPDPVKFASDTLGISLTPEQESMIRSMHEAGQRKYDRQFLGKWEDDNE